MSLCHALLLMVVNLSKLIFFIALDIDLSFLTFHLSPVEWSTSESFEPMCGTGFITNIKSPNFNITGLTRVRPQPQSLTLSNILYGFVPQTFIWF